MNKNLVTPTNIKIKILFSTSFEIDPDLKDQHRIQKRQSNAYQSEHTSFHSKWPQLGSNLIADRVESKKIHLPSWVNLATEMNNNDTSSFLLENKPGNHCLTSPQLLLLL